MYSSRCATRTIFSNWSQCMRATPLGNGVECITRSGRRRRTERYASQRCVEPACHTCHTSPASWLNRCQFWSRGCRPRACAVVFRPVSIVGQYVWRTSANGDEVEGTTDVIARLVAFKFSFTNGDGMSEIPPVPCLTGTVEYSTVPVNMGDEMESRRRRRRT